MGAADFIAVRYVLTGVLCTIGIGLGALTQNRILLAVGAAVGAVVGLYAPMLWLRQRRNKRRFEIEIDLPDVIDVLVVCVEAGLTFEAAMEKVVEKYDHALASEFGRAIQEVRLGRPRLDALNDMGRRTGVEDLNNFVQAIIQAEQLGSGISRILRIQSDEMRLRRDHETLGTDGSMGDLPRVLVHQGQSRHELPDQTQRSIDVERDPFPLGQRENLREPYTRRVLGHERKGRTGVAQALHAADTSVTGVAKAREPADALAQREFK